MKTHNLQKRTKTLRGLFLINIYSLVCFFSSLGSIVLLWQVLKQLPFSVTKTCFTIPPSHKTEFQMKQNIEIKDEKSVRITGTKILQFCSWLVKTNMLRYFDCRFDTSSAIYFTPVCQPVKLLLACLDIKATNDHLIPNLWSRHDLFGGKC